jgi:DnaJ family protein C protein 28
MPELSIEEIIRQAMQDGKFDDLPGKGKPLHLDQNVHEDPEWRATFHILKTSGFTLPWIESLREIESQLEKARTDLARSWNWHQVELNEHPENPLPEAEWARSIETFKSQITIINKKIRQYNLEVPSERFQRPIIDPKREIERLTESLDS